MLKKVQQIYTYGQPNFAGSNYNQMTSEFLTGKAAMISDGTWNVGSLREADQVDFGTFRCRPATMPPTTPTWAARSS